MVVMPIKCRELYNCFPDVATMTPEEIDPEVATLISHLTWAVALSRTYIDRLQVEFLAMHNVADAAMGNKHKSARDDFDTTGAVSEAISNAIHRPRCSETGAMLDTNDAPDACGNMLCQKRMNLKLCSRCLEVAYCCAECQLADWKGGHKAACGKRKKIREALKAAPPPDRKTRHAGFIDNIIKLKTVELLNAGNAEIVAQTRQQLSTLIELSLMILPAHLRGGGIVTGGGGHGPHAGAHNHLLSLET